MTPDVSVPSSSMAILAARRVLMCLRASLEEWRLIFTMVRKHSAQYEPRPPGLRLSAVNILSGFAVLQRGQVRRPVAAISMARCPRRGAQQVLRLHPLGQRGHSASRVVRSQAGQEIKRSARCRARSAAASISLCRDGVMCLPHRSWWHDLHVEFGRPLLW